MVKVYKLILKYYQQIIRQGCSDPRDFSNYGGILKNLGNDVFIESLSYIFHFPPSVKAAIVHIAIILWSFK